MNRTRTTQLASCANLARRLAPDHCWRDPQSGETCAAHHGFWPYVHLLGYSSSPDIHKEFYLEGLAPLAAAESPARVLISGTADFSMLETARDAFAHAARKPSFTVVDRCDTPLALCRWFAEQEGFGISTVATDILDFTDSTGFDAIVTHAFLGWIPPELRPRLAKRWFDLLRPGGRLLTINRLRPGAIAASTVPSKSQVAAFVKQMSEGLERYRSHLDCPVGELAPSAEAYVSELHFHPVRSREELVSLFEDAGLVLDICAVIEPIDPDASGPSGPTMPSGATFMKIAVHRKP